MSVQEPKNSPEETIGMMSDEKSPKLIAIQSPRKPTKSIRFQRLFFLFSSEYFGILWRRLFQREEGMMSKISIKLRDKAHIPAYLNPEEVGKNRPKNINTKRV